MLIHIILLHMLIKATCTNYNGGTAIFYNRKAGTDCWNNDEIIKLRARKAFEELIPHVNLDDVDVKYIKDLLRYLRKTLNSIDKDSDRHTRTLLKEAIADTIGAHLRSEMLPAVRFAYYAGYVPYRNARQLHNLFDEVKASLNTQGLGWKKPKRTVQPWSNLTVAKILIGAGAFFEPCSCLVTKRDSNSCIHIPIPKHDDDRNPSAVALPFKSGGLVSLTAPSSNNILLKYYTTAARCILSSSPEQCRHGDFVSFNNDLWHWMKRDVAPHLVDEKLYAAYGGVLRIAAAVQNYGKGLSRRNLFEYKDARMSIWHPWQSLTQSYIYVNADWTPTIYVGLVLLTAFSIYLVQICYNYICGEASGCNCKGASESLLLKNVAYANVDTNIPAMLPHQSTVYYNDKMPSIDSGSKQIPTSLGSIRTQKVYDMNENTEKLMEVIMSDDEESGLDSSTSQSSAEDGEENMIDDVESSKRSRSPPKLQTSMSQLTVDKTKQQTHTHSRLPTYSTSTATRTYRDKDKDTSGSVWSATGSCTSTQSGSSAKYTPRRSRSSHDLAWARRVASKHTRSITKSSKTELEFTSYTTPTSHR